MELKWVLDILFFQISIDISAPIAGVVFDAEPGQVDRDFQISSDIHTSWTGFFDKESGIKQYDLVLDSTCQTADQLIHHPNVIIFIFLFIIVFLLCAFVRI